MNSYSIHPLEEKINQSITIPGSKSFSNRALVMAALTTGESRLYGLSESDDTIAMRQALKALGVDIILENDCTVVRGTGGKFLPFSGEINVGAAGTTMRFLASICSLVPGEIILDGSERMRQRPVGELVNALRSLGAKIEYVEKENFPPLKINGGSLKGGTTQMNGEISSQYFTSLLLVGPILEKGLEIEIIGEQISKSYIDMTIQSLKERGAEVINNNYQKYSVNKNANYNLGNFYIEGDASGATYFWAVAAITGSTIRVNNILPSSFQGDIKFPDILEKMGCTVVKNEKEKWIEVTGAKELKGIEIDMENMPDTAQTLAVVASFAKGRTKITGLATLKIKETDRIEALKNELEKMEINSEIGADYIIIEGGTPKGATIETYKDHRMAMAFAVAGAIIKGMKINEPKVVAKSFPEFWEMLEKIGVKTES